MSEPITAVVDPATGMFCSDGLQNGRIVVTVPWNPDPRKDRYSGNPADPFRAATAQEITDYDAARETETQNAAFDSIRVLKALALVVADLHAKTPAQMKALVIAKYKTLG